MRHLCDISVSGKSLETASLFSFHISSSDIFSRTALGLKMSSLLPQGVPNVELEEVFCQRIKVYTELLNLTAYGKTSSVSVSMAYFQYNT